MRKWRAECTGKEATGWSGQRCDIKRKPLKVGMCLSWARLNSRADSFMLVWCGSSVCQLVECVVCMSLTLQCKCRAECVSVYEYVHAAYDCSLQLFSKTQWCRSSNYFWSWMANILLIACHFPRKGFYLPWRDARKALIIWPRWKCQEDFTVKYFTALCKIQVTILDEVLSNVNPSSSTD